MNKKILVTGYNGFIGKQLCKLLKYKGYDVIGLDTNYFGKENEFYLDNIDIKTIDVDIRNAERNHLKDVYAICHLAALSNDPMGDLNEDLTYEINYKASVRLAKLAKEAKVRKFIYSSSCSMYGISDSIKPLDERAEFNPLTAYAKSKVYTEKEISPLSDDDFSVTSLRNSTAYGISPKLRVDLVVNNLIGWALTTGKIRIMSDGTPWRPLIHCEDIARAFIAVIEEDTNIINGEAFNVGINSENYRVKEIADIIKELIPDCDITFTGEFNSDSRSYKVDFSKIERKLKKFKPVWRLKEGIKDIIESYKKYGMDELKFNYRSFIRILQLKYLIDNKKVDSNLYWLK